MNKVGLSVLFCLGILFTSCQKCSECALITTNGALVDTTYNEYCGSDLDDIEALPSYSKNGITYKWNCE